MKYETTSKYVEIKTQTLIEFLDNKSINADNQYRIQKKSAFKFRTEQCGKSSSIFLLVKETVQQ